MFMLLLTVVAWYAASAVAGSSTRRILQAYPAPVLLVAVQFTVSALAGFIMVLATNTSKAAASLSQKQSWIVWKITAAFTTGFLCLTMTMVYVPVSLSETLRAGEPLFTVALLLCVLGERVSWPVLLSLLPIVLGIGLAVLGASTSLNIVGAGAAAISNASFSLRSVYANELKRDIASTGGTPLPAVALFAMVTFRGLALIVPAAAILAVAASPEVVVPHDAAPLYETAAAVFGGTSGVATVSGLLLMNALAFFSYNQLSFAVLARSHIMTHSVANGFRRVATIAFAVVYFGTKVSLINGAGMALAIGGVLAYIKAKAAAKAPSDATASTAASGSASGGVQEKRAAAPGLSTTAPGSSGSLRHRVSGSDEAES